MDLRREADGGVDGRRRERIRRGRDAERARERPDADVGESLHAKAMRSRRYRDEDVLRMLVVVEDALRSAVAREVDGLAGGREREVIEAVVVVGDELVGEELAGAGDRDEAIVRARDGSENVAAHERSRVDVDLLSALEEVHARARHRRRNGRLRRLDELPFPARREAMLGIRLDEQPLVRRAIVGRERLHVRERAGDGDVGFFAGRRQDEIASFDGPACRALRVLHLLAVLQRKTNHAEVGALRRHDAIDERGLASDADRTRDAEDHGDLRLRGLRSVLGALDHRIEVEDRRDDAALLVAFDELSLGEARIERDERTGHAEDPIAAERDLSADREGARGAEEVIMVRVEHQVRSRAIDGHVAEMHLTRRTEQRDLRLFLRANGALELEGHRSVDRAAEREMREDVAVLRARLAFGRGRRRRFGRDDRMPLDAVHRDVHVVGRGRSRVKNQGREDREGSAYVHAKNTDRARSDLFRR
jgi:hypothetical protein